MHGSGLSSWRDLGAHVHQYPHFFITLYENLAVPNVPGVQQRWEVYRQAPEETGVAAGVGTTSKSDAKTRRGNCLKTKDKLAGDWAGKGRFLMYLTIRGPGNQNLVSRRCRDRKWNTHRNHDYKRSVAYLYSTTVHMRGCKRSKRGETPSNTSIFMQ